MNLIQQFLRYIEQNHLFQKKDRLLLAVSGGLDSVVLCELCQQAGFDFVIAHCNFQLRGDESERDEAFVKQLGERYGREVLVKKFDTETYAAGKKVSIQVAARDLRYGWFLELVRSRESGVGSKWIEKRNLIPINETAMTPDSRLKTPDYLLTAHHQDDNIETMLMNLFKGTGIAGLRGILSKQDKIIRPLLFAGKEELNAFALEFGLSWMEDSSNAADKYARNYFRNQVIPLIQKVYPGAMDNLAANIHRFKEAEILYQQSILLHKNKLFEQKGDEIHIPVLKLKKSEPLSTIIFEIIKPYHFSPGQVEEVVNLLDSESGKFIQSSTHRILKNRNWLIISANQNEFSQTFLIEEGEKYVSFEQGTLHITSCSVDSWQLTVDNKTPGNQTAVNRQPSTVNSSATLDAAKINFPLLLRKWKPGDYFYPLGMTKKKKLNRFFIDNKLSKTEKEKTWVLEMDKKIIWIVGLRIDNRFKITPQAKSGLHIEMRMG